MDNILYLNVVFEITEQNNRNGRGVCVCICEKGGEKKFMVKYVICYRAQRYIVGIISK